MYDHDQEEVEDLGWEEFIARQWESIFAGYRTWTGMRRVGRRWSDLIEIGLGCSQDVADQLVRIAIIDRPDRVEGATDAGAIVSRMVGVLADLRADLTGLDGLGPEVLTRLLDRHARLLSFIRAHAFGQDGRDDAGAPGP